MVEMQSMSKSESNCHDQLDNMRFIMKSKQDNNVMDCTGVVFDENEKG